MWLSPRLPIFLLTAIVHAGPLLAQTTHEPSAMERSRAMRSDIRGGDARQLTHLSQPQENRGGPRIIQAPSMRGDPSIRVYAASKVVQESTIVGPNPRDGESRLNPVAGAERFRVQDRDLGGHSSRMNLHESSTVTGHGGYFHTRRYIHQPVIFVRYAEPWIYCRPVQPRVIYYHRPCPPPAVVVCPPQRPSGFSFSLQF